MLWAEFHVPVNSISQSLLLVEMKEKALGHVTDGAIHNATS